MKTTIKLLLIALLIGSHAKAADDHHHKIIPGPRGGKVLESEPLHAEFLVQADKKVRVTFYDESMKPVTPQSQEIKVIAEVKSGKTILEFEKNGDGFVSKSILPEGDGYRVVIQIKNDAASKPQNFRVEYHDEVCKECKHAEYACICEHAEGAEHSEHKH
ncbi:MAG: hypothetical protein V4507_09715 [Verrucomicrobiota bacterium]|jgi:hypothetical protein